VRGGLVVGAGIFVGNVTGFFRVAVTAYLLGTHARADALAVSMGPLDSLNSVMINTMLFAFVPMLMLRRDGERMALFVRGGKIFATVLTVASALTALFAGPLASLFGPGLAPAQHAEAALLIRCLAPATAFAGGSAIFSALLYTERRFLAPVLYQSILNGMTIAGAVCLWKDAGVVGFALGYTAGAAVNLLLVWAASRDLRIRERAEIHIPAREVLAAPGMFLLYAVFISLNIVVTRAYATHGGPGMAAALEYAMRGLSVGVAYLVLPIAHTLLPEIGRLRGAGNTARAYRLIDRSLALIAAGSVLSCAIAVLFRAPVIAIMFQRGSFNAESTQLVSSVFLGFAPSLVGWTMMDLMSRCLFALDRPKLPTLTSVIPVGLNFAVMVLLRSHHALQGNPGIRRFRRADGRFYRAFRSDSPAPKNSSSRTSAGAGRVAGAVIFPPAPRASKLSRASTKYSSERLPH
jgi:putative peptidoglycan lipid II flippase